MLANYSFQDDLKTVTMMDSAVLSRTDDDVRGDVLKKAKEHDLPIDAQGDHSSAYQYAGSFIPSTFQSTIPFTINLPGYSFDMHFNPTSGNKGF